MTKPRRTLAIGLCLSLLLITNLACHSGPTSLSRISGEANDDVAGDSDPGRDAWVLPDQMGSIYATQCAVCHGRSLEGSALGSSLLADPLVHGSDVDALVRSIEDGIPETRMPPWKGVISDQDIRGLAIYLAEKRAGDPGDAGQGIGKRLALPNEPIPTTHYSLAVELLFDGLEEPYSIAPLPDGRIVATEKMKGLRLIDPEAQTDIRITGTPRFFDDGVIRGTTYTGSGWAHEVELHPDFAENGWIYLSFGDRCENCNEVSRATGKPVTMLKLVRGRLRGNRWTDQETIWEAEKSHYQAGAENGASARIAFDTDGFVYMTIGQFTDYAGVQDLARPDGKIIRVHDDGRIPEDNPFVEDANALPSIWTLGHRNAQGLAYDASTQRLWSSEHGPRGGDEANLILPGRNYGWPLVSLGVDYDGRPVPYAKKLGIDFDPATLTPTKIDWTPSPGVSSIVFYEGEPFSAWRGHMIVATLARNDLWRYVVDANGERERETLIRGLGRFRDIEIAPNGDLIALLEHREGSRIIRIRPTEPTP